METRFSVDMAFEVDEGWSVAVYESVGEEGDSLVFGSSGWPSEAHAARAVAAWLSAYFDE